MSASRHPWACLVFLYVSAILFGCDYEHAPDPVTGSGYAPVTESELIKATYSHRTGRKKYEFTWVFESERFAIEGPEIPQDLALALLDSEEPVDHITGTWQIKDEIITFVTETDGELHECSLRVFFTGVIRIQTDAAQYVF